MQVQGYLKKHLYSHIKRSSGMLLVILIIDLIPLYGVLYLGWGTMDSVYLYFFETLIISAITFLKMRKAGNILAFSKWQKRIGKKATDNTGKAGQMVNQITSKRFGFIRFLILFAFLLINIPLCLLMMMSMLWIEGKGFSLASIFGYDGGHTELFVMSVNTFYIFIFLLIAEHFYTYIVKYIGQQEFKKAGMLNEALTFELRMFVQSIVMIGGVALIFFFDFSKIMVITLIILKTLIDLFIYLRNRYWSNMVSWIDTELDKIDNKA